MKDRVGDFLWTFSAIFLTLISKIFFAPGPVYTGGEYYLLFSLLYACLIFFLHKRGVLEKFKISPFFFILGLIIIMFSSPLFENDHYRYLWEGKVLFSGHNPYLFPPDSPVLKDIYFSKKALIGFPYLTTIYPPLALLFFGLGGVLDYSLGLKLLMAINAVMVWKILKELKNKTTPWMLFLVIPYLQKEFVQSIHIDLLAFFFLFLAFLSLVKNKKHGLLFIALGFWSKILTVLLLPAYLIYEKSNLKRILLLGSFLLFPLFLFYVTNHFLSLNGLKQFSKYWVWNAGAFSGLRFFLPWGDSVIRRICGGLFIFYYLSVFYLFIKLKQNKREKTQNILIFSYLSFIGLMFFSPVFNGWYAIWFLGPALMLNLRFGVIYGFFSFAGYIYYFSPDYLWLGQWFTHLWFPLSIFEVKERLEIEL